MRTVDELLDEARRGNGAALRELLALLYDDLRRIARARLRPHADFTLLDTTAVVHESIIRLVGLRTLDVESREHFFAYASRVMRTVIVDYARARDALRRGGDHERVTLPTEAWRELPDPASDVVGVAEALAVLERAEPRLGRVVEMRFFGGLTETEIAEALDMNERTVRRDLVKARLLLKELLA